MKNVGWAALIGMGVALVAFIVDWALDYLDTPEEPEPLWPADKPYSRMTVHWATDDWVVRPMISDDPATIPAHWHAEYHYRFTPDDPVVDHNFLNPTPETWEMP